MDQATFHQHCWETLLKDARRRKRTNATIKISLIEQTLIKDAAKAMEKHDSIATLRLASSRIASLMRKAKHCVVFTGAGISTSAGIGDYRGKGGKWTEMDRKAVTKEVSTLIGGSNDATKAEPKNDDDDDVPYEDLRPTYTHEALAKLMELGIVKYIISQNCDDLHGLSGVDYQHLAELHGNIYLEICEKCRRRYYRHCYVMDDLASQYYEDLQDYGHSQLSKPSHARKCEHCELNHRTGRKCEVKDCNGFLKDSIINFGDNLEEDILTAAEEQAKQADLIISLGTTMRVTPACDLVLMGREPLQLVIVNRQRTGFDKVCIEGEGVRVFGDCDQVMREVMTLLLPHKEEREWEMGREERMEEYDARRKL